MENVIWDLIRWQITFSNVYSHFFGTFSLFENIWTTKNADFHVFLQFLLKKRGRKTLKISTFQWQKKKESSTKKNIFFSQSCYFLSHLKFPGVVSGQHRKKNYTPLNLKNIKIEVHDFFSFFFNVFMSTGKTVLTLTPKNIPTTWPGSWHKNFLKKKKIWKKNFFWNFFFWKFFENFLK